MLRASSVCIQTFNPPCLITSPSEFFGQGGGAERSGRGFRKASDVFLLSRYTVSEHKCMRRVPKLGSGRAFESARTSIGYSIAESNATTLVGGWPPNESGVGDEAP